MTDGGDAVRIGESGPQRDRKPPDRVGSLVALAILVIAAVLSVSGVFRSSDSATDSRAITTTTTTAPSTTTTLSVEELAALEYEADVELISQLWWGQTTAWASGFDSGVQFWVENNYPDMGCSFDDYMQSWFSNGAIDGLQIERIVNKPTIRKDDGWKIPGGDLKGVAVKGRVYVMAVRDRFTLPDLDPPADIRDFHVTILDGQAHFFVDCST